MHEKRNCREPAMDLLTVRFGGRREGLQGKGGRDQIGLWPGGLELEGMSTTGISGEGLAWQGLEVTGLRIDRPPP